jgi:hypothetical protein
MGRHHCWAAGPLGLGFPVSLYIVTPSIINTIVHLPTTAKVDVYSFGVILLELICCRRNVELEAAEENQKILTYWANDCYRCGRVDFLVEGDEEAISNLKVVERFVAVALLCVQEDPTMRPTMLKVTRMLDGVAAIPTPADPSSFISSLR